MVEARLLARKLCSGSGDHGCESSAPLQPMGIHFQEPGRAATTMPAYFGSELMSSSRSFGNDQQQKTLPKSRGRLHFA